MAWNCVKTDKGLALEAKTIAGATITLTRCVSGAGKVATVDLRKQTAVTTEKQSLSVQSIKVTGNKYSIRAVLSNLSLTTGYDMYQVGFYATDPQDGEILFAIAQIDNAKVIPSKDESPGYAIEFTFTFENSSDANIDISIDTSGFAMIETVAEMIDSANEDVVRCEDATDFGSAEDPDSILSIVSELSEEVANLAETVGSITTTQF